MEILQGIVERILFHKTIFKIMLVYFRVENSIKAMHGDGNSVLSGNLLCKPLWEGVNESDSLFMTNNDIMAGGEGKADTTQNELKSGIPPKAACSKPAAAISSQSDLWSFFGIDSKTRIQRWTPLHCCVLGWACAAALGRKSERPNLCAKRALGSVPPNEMVLLSKKLHKRDIALEGLSGDQPDGNRGLASSKRGGLTGMSHAKGVQKSLKKNDETLRGVDNMLKSNLLCSALKEGDHELVALVLIKNGAFIDSLDCHARTPLMIAAACNLLEAICILLDSGANMSLKDTINGNTALHYAYAAGSMAAASLLEERGASLDILNAQGLGPVEVTGVLSVINGGILK